jgi:hypothetical protein
MCYLRDMSMFTVSTGKVEWWLSFSNTDKGEFRGACIVLGSSNRIEDIDSAIRQADALHISPEAYDTVVGYPLPAEDLPFIAAGYRRRLLTWQECDALAAELSKRTAN